MAAAAIGTVRDADARPAASSSAGGRPELTVERWDNPALQGLAETRADGHARGDGAVRGVR